MFRRLVLWWQVRRCESDLRFLRQVQRENPDDPNPKQLIPLVEGEYRKLELERTCRLRGWHWAFRCSICLRDNVSFVPPVACVYCGLDAPPDVPIKIPELQAANGQVDAGRNERTQG